MQHQSTPPRTVTAKSGMGLPRTMRREWPTFGLDRILTYHPLTTPHDVEEAA